VKGWLKDIIIVAASILAITYGAQFLVDEAAWFALSFGMSQEFIGMSLIAIGTSLPELSVSISAGRKKLGGMVLGNVIGSNIANLLLIIGVSSFITPLFVSTSIILFMAPFMIAMSFLLLFFIKSHWQIRKMEGVLFLCLYIAFIAFIFMKGLY